MNWVRELVGGPKNRYMLDGFNLDLTYITSRIIAMAFPASGIEKLYRNSVDDIGRLLEKHHKNKYITINLSGRPVDEKTLQNVRNYEWEDHKAPPFDTLFRICEEVVEFLAEDEERIAVFHCNHGKGRTGTIICCFFLYMNIFKDCETVMRFYAKQRFKTQGYGVTQPCQIQYIRYFGQYLANPKLFPDVLRLKKITFKGGYHFSDPYLKLINMTNNTVIYNTKTLNHTLEIEKDSEYSITIKEPSHLHMHCFTGDITMEIKNENKIGKNKIANYVFNTAFINYSRTVVAKLKDLSPLGMQKSGNFDEDFEINLEFRKVCECGSSRRFEGCQKCKGILELQKQKWAKIIMAIEVREKYLPMRDLICFGHEKEDLEV